MQVSFFSPNYVDLKFLLLIIIPLVIPILSCIFCLLVQRSHDKKIDVSEVVNNWILLAKYAVDMSLGVVAITMGSVAITICVVARTMDVVTTTIIIINACR